MKTVGQILKSQREKKKLTVNDVYKFIRIHPRFITALENDNYSGFEGRVHAKGFLKIYTDFLELNINEINERTVINQKNHKNKTHYIVSLEFH